MAETPSGTLDPSRDEVIFQRLQAAGFSGSEIVAASAKLQALTRQFDGHASLSPDVQEVLLELSARFVQSTAENAVKFARHRESAAVGLEDVRMYVEGRLGLHVPGFGPALPSAEDTAQYVHWRKDGPGRVSREELRVRQLKRKAQDVQEEGK